VRAPRLRARVHEALVCPYCRDTVKKRGTVACARRGCGALYHRECWEECSAQYGGCAVFGCESKRAKEVSAAGYVLKLARLLLAAVLFPSRLVRKIGEEERRGRSLWQRSLEEARRLDPRRAKGADAVGVLVVYVPALGGGMVLSMYVALCAVYGVEGARALPDWHVPLQDHIVQLLTVLVFAVTVIAAALIPLLIGVVLALGLNFMRLLGRVFLAEVSAMARADQGGTTVLGRLRSGEGKKEETH
jgi:hypothetical protein